VLHPIGPGLVDEERHIFSEYAQKVEDPDETLVFGAIDVETEFSGVSEKVGERHGRF
jgi:hypothetical protein